MTTLLLFLADSPGPELPLHLVLSMAPRDPHTPVVSGQRALSLLVTYKSQKDTRAPLWLLQDSIFVEDHDRWTDPNWVYNWINIVEYKTVSFFSRHAVGQSMNATVSC